MKNQPHIFPSTPAPSDFTLPIKKHRGSYNCGRCGQPKKGHVCHLTNPSADSSSSVLPPPRVPYSHLRRALSFDDADARCDEIEDSDEAGGFPATCVWEILKRLPPAELMAAAMVCKRWRETVRRLWKAAEELRIRVPVRGQLGFVGSVLQKCTSLVRLSLTMESDVDSTMLACIAFSCPNLESLEIHLSEAAVNRITGEELSRFVAEKRCLTTLKMEGCSNLGGLVLCSSNLSTVWLSDLHSLSKKVFNCPSLKEVSLDFSRQENDCTDLVSVVDALGRSSPRLQNVHIASFRLSHAAVLALTAANLRGLRMLSLVLGSGITDASVAAIASSYSKLELLDLSGSSISDSGIGMICNVFPGTLCRLLLALCPNITSSGIQFAAAQLPHLELLDCGMSICDPSAPYQNSDETGDFELQPTFENKVQLISQKLIIKHNRLKKLSLWGCSGLDALYLNCPELNDLNLNSCRNLHPERLLLECSHLETVYASGCHKMLVETIEGQVSSNFTAMENQFPNKRLADGSKRIRVPLFLHQQSCDEDKKRRRLVSRRCNVVID